MSHSVSDPSSQVDDGGSNLAERVRLLEAHIKNLQFSLAMFSDDMVEMTRHIQALENVRTDETKKKVEGEISSISRLDEYKMGFMKTNPHERDGSDMTNFELVLWSSYVLKDDPKRREILNPTEAYKRTRRTKAIVDYYKELAISKGLDPEKAEKVARQRAKDFIEFMLLQVTQQGNPLNFWQATSDWAINNYNGHFATWQTVKDIDDRPPV